MNGEMWETIKTFFLNLFTMFVDFIRSAKSMEFNSEIWDTCKELGAITINFLRETFDLFIN